MNKKNDNSSEKTLQNSTASIKTLIRPHDSSHNKPIDNEATQLIDGDTTQLIDRDTTQLIDGDTTQLIDRNATRILNKSEDSVKKVNRHVEEETELLSSVQNSEFTQIHDSQPTTAHEQSIIGSTIKNRFTIRQPLGEGGMGMVYQALDLRKVEAEDEAPCIAIKLLTNSFKDHPDAFKSLQREAKKTQALAHPNIITVYDFDRDGDTVFMTMEELSGYPLDAIIKGKSDINLQKNPKIALRIITETAKALAYAHSKGIIHSDLKPSNIFYTKTGQTKVLDFGIARALNNKLYKDSFDAGELHALTPKYASQEMLKNAAPDPTDDIYALGLIAGQLLSGAHPYDGNDASEAALRALKPRFPHKLTPLYKRLLTRAVALERKDRIQSATQFLSGLQWAEKGPFRLCVTGLLLIALVIANTYIIRSVDDDIPLSALPKQDQQTVLLNIAEADTALKFQDYNGALIYLDRVYKLHPSNNDVEDRAEKILTAIELQFDKNTVNGDDNSFLAEQLSDVKDYNFLTANKKYQQLLEKFQQ